MFSVIFYTNNNIENGIINYCLKNLETIVNKLSGELITVSWSPLEIGKNIVTNLPREIGHRNLFSQILEGIKEAEYDYIFLAEHDVLYPENHFQIQETSNYNRNIYHLNRNGFFKTEPVNFLSTLSGPKDEIEKLIKEKLDECDVGITWSEPIADFREGELPILDIRHNKNFTGHRESKNYSINIDLWGNYQKLWKQLDSN